MAKKNNNPHPVDATEELILMRMSIRALKERVCEDLEAMADQIARLLPPEDDYKHQRYKNFTKEDWGKFLEGKLR